MLKIKMIIFICICMLISSSCAKEIGISSFPTGADIIFNGKQMGTTPFSSSEEKLGEPNSAGGYLFSIEKEGYQRFWLWQPSGIDGLKVSVNLSAFPIRKKERGFDEFVLDPTKFSSKSNRLLILQKLLFTNQIDQLDAILKKEEQNYRKLGSFYYLKAVVAIKKNDRKAGLEAITKAHELAPSIAEFVVLKNRLSNDKLDVNSAN